MEELNNQSLAAINNEHIALVRVEGSWQSECIQNQMAGRVRRNVRRTDWVLISGTLCLIVLANTTLEGAQVVAQRLHALLADVEHIMQVLSGPSAQNALQTLHNVQSLYVVSGAIEHATLSQAMSDLRSVDGLPYLAFLASYPSHRLLHLVPYDLACHYQCVPVGVERGLLTLATCRRLERDVVAHFEEVTQKSIFQVRCEAGLIEDVLRYWQNVVTV